MSAGPGRGAAPARRDFEPGLHVLLQYDKLAREDNLSIVLLKAFVSVVSFEGYRLALTQPVYGKLRESGMPFSHHAAIDSSILTNCCK